MRILVFALCGLLLACQPNRKETERTLHGLEKPVEIIRDTLGVNHIYAQTEHDLFFAQGYCAAKDRLFQFEIWRRQATGTVAELFGERELKRDIGARLFMFRGDLKQEFNHYHPQGEQIIKAFTEGVNAYIEETENNPELLPLEFKLLGIAPERWSPEVVISRHQGLLGNLTSEVANARAVALLGTQKVLDLKVFEPGVPDLSLDPSIDQSGLFEDVIELYEAFRRPITFKPEDLKSASISDADYFASIQNNQELYDEILHAEKSIGSNNWIIAASRSASGYPMLANDPHRAVTVPSLRYMVHLNAPGWNVVGGGEPTIPGVSIGHNEVGAWGLTVFDIDSEDLMVYQLNSSNPNQYKFNGVWETMKIIKDTIHVKGSEDVLVELKYTKHGPVTFIDTKRNVAYAVRCGWLEPGGAPYLASLRMNVATSWDEFREACSYSHIPGENMIWADKEGNIGWQAVGVAPVRNNFSGLVPVPGDGRFEWNGFLPIKELPNTLNPQQGFFATANASPIAATYPHRNAVGWEWADSSRTIRINELLQQQEEFTQDDMIRFQTDYYSVPAGTLVPLLKDINPDDPLVREAKDILLKWDYILNPNSIAAAIYVAWEKTLTKKAHEIFVPEKAHDVIRTVWLKKVIGWIHSGRPELNGRDRFLRECFEEAITELTEKLGSDMSQWQYGQARNHHVRLKHPLSSLLTDSLRLLYECGPLPRGGNTFTLGVTSNNDNQSHGATFRMIADVSDWDKTLFTNSPGQSGDVNSRYYKNLFSSWANDEYAPIYFTKSKIENEPNERLHLVPKPE